MTDEMIDGDLPEDGRLVLCTRCQQIAWHDEARCILCGHKPLALMTPVPADDADALEVLQRFQAWRRGHDPRTPTDVGLSTAAIGEAIDAGIQALATTTQEAPHGARESGGDAGMTGTYQITLTAEQAELIRTALEACARMGIGQIEDALTFYPTAEFRPDGWHEAMDQIQGIMLPFSKKSRPKAMATHRRLWSMMTSIRNRLAWDRAVADGTIQEGEPRKWPEMMQVSYDEPDSSDWPNLKVERIAPHEKEVPE